MNIDINQLTRAAVLIVVGGLVLLAFTFLVEFLLPLIVFAVLIVIAFFAYTFFKTGSFKP